MQKPLALSIAACLGLAGCHVFESSETWNHAVQVRPGETTLDPDPSHAYAAKLHAALLERGVEHKVVVYQYHYTTRFHEEALGTRTAVIYRDNGNASYPWWLKDDRLNNPFWLPNGDLEKQISFYIRRKAEVIETKEYPAGGGSGKAAFAFAKPKPTLRSFAKPETQVAVTSVRKPVAPVTSVARASVPAKPSTVAKASEPVKFHVFVKARPASKPEPVKARLAAKNTEEKAPSLAKAAGQKKPESTQTVANAGVTKIKLPTTFFTPTREPEADSAAAPPPIASHNGGSTVLWSPPTILDPTEQTALTAPRDTHLEKLFRANNGTDYNRFSPIDRRKMQRLQHDVASRE